ncbi:MAG: hypothetical protein KAH48_10850 [Chlorobi bacterium]|nr:hypothetical protein [Chlorobiota bacterium]
MKNFLKVMLPIILLFVTMNLISQPPGRLTKPFANVQNGTTTWLFDQTDIKEAFENAWDVTISDIYLDISNYSYLVMHAMDNSTQEYRTFAVTLETVPNLVTGGDDIQFEENGDIPEQKTSQTHSCNGGTACSFCVLVKNNEGQVEGCDCSVEEEICGHSVSETVNGKTLYDIFLDIAGIFWPF